MPLTSGVSPYHVRSLEPARPFNLVAIVGESPISSFLIQEIGRTHKFSTVVRPVRSGDRSKRRRSKLSGLQRASSKARGRYYAWQGRRLNQSISRQLFDSPNWPSIDAAEIYDHEINGDSSVNYFGSLSPDLLLVCGAPILKPRLFQIPRLGALNLHFGIAPKYRGQNTLFWALQRRDYDNLGFTLHLIDQGIDSGDIVARGYPELCPGDWESDIIVKCARMAAGVITDFLTAARDLAQIPAVPHRFSFPVFRERDRAIQHDLDLLYQRRILGRRLPTRPARTERMYANAIAEANGIGAGHFVSAIATPIAPKK